MLTAQALVAPISSNTDPRSQVIKDKAIAVTTSSYRVSREFLFTLLRLIRTKPEKRPTKRCGEYQMEVRIVGFIGKPIILKCELGLGFPTRNVRTKITSRHTKHSTVLSDKVYQADTGKNGPSGKVVTILAPRRLSL